MGRIIFSVRKQVVLDFIGGKGLIVKCLLASEPEMILQGEARGDGSRKGGGNSGMEAALVGNASATEKLVHQRRDCLWRE